MREPIRFSLDQARRLRTATMTGVIREDDLLSAFAALAHDNGLDSLVDMRCVERLDVTGESIRRLAGITSHVGDANGANTAHRLAIVAPRDDLFGIARMYQTLRSDTPREMRVFRDYDSAIQWLDHN